MESNAPFPETLKAIQDELAISQREIARRCEKNGWGSVTSINQMIRGELTPSLNALKAIAKALGVPPETFAEYRLAMARRSLDPGEVGLETALENLGYFTAGPVSGDPVKPHRNLLPARRRQKGGRGG